MKRIALALILSAGMIGQSGAQNWPQRPIRLVNPFAAGGSIEFFGRIMAPKMSEGLGQPVVIESRPGASGMTGLDFVAKGPADGYTLVLAGPSSLTILPLLTRVPYSIENELALLTIVARVPNLITANGRLGIGSLEELVKAARQSPGKFNYGSSGTGGTLHLAGALLAQELKIELTHVPYKGVAPAMTDLIGGQVQLLVANANVPLPHLKGGAARALAITSPKRSPVLPEVPSVVELGFASLVSEDVIGLVAQAKTPRPVQDRIIQAATTALRLPEVSEKYAEQAALAAPSSPQEYRQWVDTESRRWAEVIKRNRITLE